MIFHNILPIINDIENIFGVLFGFFRGHFLGFRQGSKIFLENFTQETGTTKTPVLITGTFVWKSAVFERFSVDPGATPRKSVEKSRKRPLNISGKSSKSGAPIINPEYFPAQKAVPRPDGTSD